VIQAFGRKKDNTMVEKQKKKLTSRGIARWWRDESWGRFVNRQGVDESKTQKEDGMKN